MKLMDAMFAYLYRALAAIAMATIAFTLLMIVANVLLRDLDLSLLSNTVALTEYGLLYMTMAGAPWLLHERGHIYIEVLIDRMRPAVRRVVERLICLIGAATCGVIAWAAFRITVSAYVNHEYDIRSFLMPFWALYGAVALSFAIMGVEFLRILLAGSSPHAAQRASPE